MPGQVHRAGREGRRRGHRAREGGVQHRGSGGSAGVRSGHALVPVDILHPDAQLPATKVDSSHGFRLGRRGSLYRGDIDIRQRVERCRGPRIHRSGKCPRHPATWSIGRGSGLEGKSWPLPGALQSRHRHGCVVHVWARRTGRDSLLAALARLYARQTKSPGVINGCTAEGRGVRETRRRERGKTRERQTPRIYKTGLATGFEAGASESICAPWLATARGSWLLWRQIARSAHKGASANACPTGQSPGQAVRACGGRKAATSHSVGTLALASTYRYLPLPA